VPDMSERMARTVAKSPAATPAKPFSKDKPYPHRVTLDLSAEDYSMLRQEAFQAETAIAALLRGMVAACRDNPKMLKEAISKAAQQSR
jgi:hypothetical protein